MGKKIKEILHDVTLQDVSGYVEHLDFQPIFKQNGKVKQNRILAQVKIGKYRDQYFEIVFGSTAKDTEVWCNGKEISNIVTSIEIKIIAGEESKLAISTLVGYKF